MCYLFSAKSLDSTSGARVKNYYQSQDTKQRYKQGRESRRQGDSRRYFFGVFHFLYSCSTQRTHELPFCKAPGPLPLSASGRGDNGGPGSSPPSTAWQFVSIVEQLKTTQKLILFPAFNPNLRGLGQQEHGGTWPSKSRTQNSHYKHNSPAPLRRWDRFPQRVQKAYHSYGSNMRNKCGAADQAKNILQLCMKLYEKELKHPPSIVCSLSPL